VECGAYLALPSIEMSKYRVTKRVKHGGHNIPTKDIERRFSRSLNNLLTEFSHLVDNCLCFINSGKEPILIFEQQGEHRHIADESLYQLLLRYSK